MNLTAEYTRRVGLGHRRRFGQFFTPPRIAKFMVDWTLPEATHACVHDPAFGMGAFFENAPRGCDFTGTEIDPEVISFYDAHFAKKPSRIECADYLLDFGKSYCNVVCNPPYLRFQKFLNRDLVFRAFQERLGVRLSGYTNIASAFLVKSISELKEDGRLAYILPSEFLNAGYGELVKDWLVKDRHLDSIIKVECEREAFDEVITSVCIVLYDKSRVFDSVAFRKVSAINQFESVLSSDPVNAVRMDRLRPREKWERFFLERNERVVPNRSRLVELKTYGRFSRGIATGANEFFVLTKGDVERRGLSSQSCLPCITKSQQLKAAVFFDSDFRALSDSNTPVYLFAPGLEPDRASVAYIKEGETLGYDKRFITRHRAPWYKTERREVSPILLNVFSRDGYKVVRNYSSALTLTNFHCFYPNRLGVDYVDWLFLYLHSNVGRKILSLSKRKYGDSLDKFEPNDLNSALVPRKIFFDAIGRATLDRLMAKIKNRKDVEVEVDAVFSPLLSVGGEIVDRHECRPACLHPTQLLLAVERGKGKPVAAKKSAKSAGGKRVREDRKPSESRNRRNQGMMDFDNRDKTDQTKEG